MCMHIIYQTDLKIKKKLGVRGSEARTLIQGIPSIALVAQRFYLGQQQIHKIRQDELELMPRMPWWMPLMVIIIARSINQIHSHDFMVRSPYQLIPNNQQLHHGLSFFLYFPITSGIIILPTHTPLISLIPLLSCPLSLSIKITLTDATSTHYSPSLDCKSTNRVSLTNPESFSLQFYIEIIIIYTLSVLAQWFYSYVLTYQIISNSISSSSGIMSCGIINFNICSFIIIYYLFMVETMIKNLRLLMSL